MILGSAADASSLAFFLVPNHQCHDVGVKRYFDPSDTELLRALHSRNSKNIRNLLIFLQKMASYSCFGGSQVQKSYCKQACVGFLTF